MTNDPSIVPVTPGAMKTLTAIGFCYAEVMHIGKVHVLSKPFVEDDVTVASG